MWKIIKIDLIYYSNYYLMALILFFLSIGIIITALQYPKLAVYTSPILNVTLYISAYIFAANFYNSKLERERINALLPVTFDQRKGSKYIVYLIGLGIISFVFLVTRLIDNNFNGNMNSFNTAVIASGAAFLIVEYLHLKVFNNKLINVISSVLISGIILGITILGGDYFFPIIETNILYADYILSVIWAVILMNIAGYFYSKRKSFLQSYI